MPGSCGPVGVNCESNLDGSYGGSFGTSTFFQTLPKGLEMPSRDPKPDLSAKFGSVEPNNKSISGSRKPPVLDDSDRPRILDSLQDNRE